MAMEEIRERYELAMERIRAMKQEKTVSAPFYAYFQKMADFILEMDAYRASVEKGEPERLSLAELQEQNRRRTAMWQAGLTGKAMPIRREQWKSLARVMDSFSALYTRSCAA